MNNFLRQFSERQLIALAIALALIVRGAAVAVLQIDPVSDYLAYDQMARKLLAGKVMTDSFGNAAFYSGGYPLFFLAPIYALFGHSVLAAQFGNAVLGAVSTYLVYLLLRETKAGAVARVAGPLMFALYVPSWLYCEYLAKENLMTPLLLALVYVSARLHQHPTMRLALLGGAIVAALSITGSAALALLPLALAALVFANASISQRLRAGLAFLLAAMLLLAPWQYRNQQVIGSPVVNTNGGFNLYLGNNPNADGMFVSIAATPLGDSWKDIRSQGEVRASNQLRDAAIQWISENPVEFVQLALKKAVLFWTPPVHEGKGKPSTMENLVRGVWLLQYLVLCVPALYVLVTLKKRNRFVAGTVAGIVLYTGVHMLFYVIFRYREPIMPMLIVLSAIGIESLVARFGALPARAEARFYSDGDINENGQLAQF